MKQFTISMSEEEAIILTQSLAHRTEAMVGASVADKNLHVFHEQILHCLQGEVDADLTFVPEPSAFIDMDYSWTDSDEKEYEQEEQDE